MCDDASNARLTWTKSTPIVSAPTLVSKDQRWDWSWVYHRDLERMANILSTEAKRALEDTSVEEGMTVIRPDPASPGVLFYLEFHALTCNGCIDLTTSPTTPTGIHLRPGSSPSAPYSAGDPLVLFLPSCFKSDEMAIALISNLTSSIMPTVSPLFNKHRGQNHSAHSDWRGTMFSFGI